MAANTPFEKLDNSKLRLFVPMIVDEITDTVGQYVAKVLLQPLLGYSLT